MIGTYPASQLIAFAENLLRASGLEGDKARDVAEVLVEGDLLGHDTHGLALLGPYLADLENGTMAKQGEPSVVADFPAAITWDGNRLPGPWLTRRAIAVATERARKNGMCTVVISRSHHIACLASYGRQVAEQGLMLFLTCSDPAARGVAPHGGKSEVMTPNPIAAAWPTKGQPVILDISCSISTNGMTKRLQTEGGRFPGLWAIDGEGNPTDDPRVFAAQPAGALLPTGGVDHGHKGFALGLMVEAMTSSLAGHGRADPPEGRTANVMLQVFDPALFGGTSDFLRQSSHMADLCRQTPPRLGFDHVRLPGERGLARRETQLKEGVALHPSIMPTIKPWAEKWGVSLPSGQGT